MNDAYSTRIGRAVDFIQANLGADLSVKQLADLACFSEFHFNRVFRAEMGESVHQFIQRLRLEKAAELLRSNPGMPITDIALACGYATSSAFAKGFKKQFGMSASMWREQARDSSGEPTGPGKISRGQFSIDNGMPVWTFDNEKTPRRVAVKNLAPVTVAYIRYIGPYQGNDVLFDDLYTRLYQWAVPQGHVTGPATRYNIYYDSPDITDHRQLRVMAAIPVPDRAIASDTVGITTLDGGQYAVCRLLLPKEGFTRAWEWMFTAWFKTSGYALDNRAFFEKYLGETTRDGCRLFDVEICVPVRPI